MVERKTKIMEGNQNENQMVERKTKIMEGKIKEKLKKNEISMIYFHTTFPNSFGCHDHTILLL